MGDALPSSSYRTRAASVLAVLLFTLGNPCARADLHFPQPRFDAGVVRTGTPLAQKFAFTNRGSQTVEVLEVRSSCGCLTPKLEPRVYRPGEEGALRVEINTLTHPTGPHSWVIHVRYRSQEEMSIQEAQVYLGAQLLAEVMIQPAALVLFTDKALSHELVLTDLRPRPLAVTDVRTSTQGLKPQVLEQTRDAQGRAVCKIRLEVTEEYPEGRREEIVNIYTNDPGYRDLKVPVTIVKRSRQRLAATPSQVSLTAPPGQPIPSRIVLLRDNDDQAVVVDRVVSDNPAISVHWAQGPERMATLRIRVDRSHVGPASLHSAVHVHVSKPVPDVLTIPVSFSSP